MKQDTDYEKRELLINAAKDEFLEKGYNKASLRSICAKAGVTTGALYFFFENKADLFSAIVDGPINELKDLLINHFKDEYVEWSNIESIDELDLDHEDVSNAFAECIYRNYDCYMILLTGAENTIYENLVDEFADIIEHSVTDTLAKAIKGYTFDPFMSHWMAHMTIDSYIHVIKHVNDLNTASKMLYGITNYVVQGWISLALVKKEN